MYDQRGILFHIIHGSLVDGHGVRTTVFLKGCPLRCSWCCNPEGQQSCPEIKLTVSECNACGNCIKVCPTGAIQLNPRQENAKIEINRGLCTNCGKCTEVCFTGALDFFGRYISVDELFEIVKKDEAFYRASGGGVTIGGGEPTFQPFFTRAFLKKCRENYIHTALDTCGYTVNEEGAKALEEADLLLYDIKGIDSQEHWENTGVSNEHIMENIKKSDSLRKPIIIRMPLIPGYNASKENILAAARFLAGLKYLERVDLLVYHEYGKVKYAQLGREYNLAIHPPKEDQLNEIKYIFESHGLKVQLGG
jgi:pyruvate formate lyase activating enzyme